MRKIFLSFFALFVLISTVFAQMTEGRLQHGGLEREYYLYLPKGISENAPLVIVMHGYGGDATAIMHLGMNKVADAHGFAVCYPRGWKDLNGKRGWNVGYPAQKGMVTDDVDFICNLATHLQQKYNFSRDNSFCTGMSNGGDMCYLIAYRRPEAFAALASVAGLTLEWTMRKYLPKQSLPIMEIHGTADRVSMWNGDPYNKGGWGEYMAVPLAVGVWVAAAGCTHEITEILPRKENRRKVILHRYTGGRPAWDKGPQTEVLLYEVVGGPHS